MKRVQLFLNLTIVVILTSCGNPIENQEFIQLNETNPQRSKHTRYGLTDTSKNNFDLNSGMINLMIPITESKLTAKYCEKVSSDSLSAIVVVLDGNQGNLTKESPVIGFQKMQVSIKKLKLNTAILKDSLQVFILHDNRYKEDNLKKVYEQCVEDAKYYSDIECNFYLMSDQSILNNAAPREQGGDIIPPTGG